MATISITSYTQFYNSATGSDTGTGSGKTEVIAKAAALNNAHPSVPTPGNGGSSSNTKMFGSKLGLTQSSGISEVESTPSGIIFHAIGTKTYTSTIYQLKLGFTLPSGVSANQISTATLTFAGSQNVDASVQYKVCGPAGNTAQTNYQKYSTSTILNKTNAVSFNSQGTTKETYSITITNILQDCINNSQGWVTLVIPIDTPGSNHQITIDSASIEYTLSTTKCSAPTSVSSNVSIQKPNTAVTISWSGASGGIGNAITGYTVYYKVGGWPTTSSYNGTIDATSTSCGFTIPNSATRGSIYYFKVVTKGAAGSSWYSDISSNGASVSVNQLPAAPTASASPTRIKSSGSTTVIFTVTAGNDANTGQTKTLYYATSASGTKTVFTSPLSQSLSNAATYYFWTYDGLEYSSSTAVSIVKNTPPTIGSITMSAVATYSPSKNGRNYVKNISASANNVTGTNLTYQWALRVGSGTGATTFNSVTNISNNQTLGNIDVTAYGAHFDTAYKLQLTVTDDLGESAVKQSSDNNVFCIPDAPAISSIKNKNSKTDNTSGTNESHFDQGLSFIYAENNTGLTRELLYSTNSNFSSYNIISLTGTDYSYANLSNLTRGQTYYFKIRFRCNSRISLTSSTTGYFRTNDITPNISTITPQSGSVIKPYTQSILNFAFTNSPIKWENAQDVAEPASQSAADIQVAYNAIYSIKFKYSTRSLAVSSAGTNSSGTVTGTVTLSSIPTASWKTLLGFANDAPAPNTSYTITLEITATNGFGKTFTSSKNFTVNFVEGFVVDQGSAVLSIFTSASQTVNIPDTYTSSNRYSLFETEKIRFTISGFQCYANQAVTFRIRKSNSTGQILATATSSASDFTGPSGRIYTLNTKNIDYTIPELTSSADATFYIEIILENGNSIPKIIDICKYRRIQIPSINPQIISITEDPSNHFTFTYKITDYGGDTNVNTGFSTASKQGGYSEITGTFIKSISSNGTYSNVGTGASINFDMKGLGTGDQTKSIDDTTNPFDNDIIYFGFSISLVVDLVPINGTMPLGARFYSKSFPALLALYREVPNVLYGKNFLVINANKPKENNDTIVADQLITIRPNKNRTKIYIGNDNEEGILEITSNGLVIDCGSW